jgi:Tol biopolymer transport system component
MMLINPLTKVLALLSTLVVIASTLFVVSAAVPAAKLPQSTPIARLTHDPANALRPVWSPDQRRIAFESNRDGAFHVYVMNADRSEERALTSGLNDDRHPAWSADGQTLVYDSNDGIRQNIWSVRLGDGLRQQLTHLDGLAEYAALSPDGQQLAFYLYRDMTLNLWAARADGTDAHPLTRDLADAQRHEPTMAWQRPGWSPDSKHLAYTGADGRSIWLMRRDGSDARSVVADGETNHFPWFLPDGQLAYITEYVPPRYDGAWTNAWAINLQTGRHTLWQEHMSMQGPMDFSADGTRVLFHSPRAGRFDIFLVDLNATGGRAALQGMRASVETAGY